MILSGWGRFPRSSCRVETPRDAAEIATLVKRGELIARGNGRAYGDAALNPELTLDMRHLDRFIEFDAENGVLVAEAGVLLADVIDALLPRGWFPAVTPGTRYVTLGGMAAADVHGKNHHRDGSFRNAVIWLDLMGPDSEVRRISAHDNPKLFDRTLGGMGLTGIILRLGVRLRRVETGWIRQTTIDAPNLDAAIAAFEENQNAHYSVGWIDCLAGGSSLGRSLVMLGEHADISDLQPAQRSSPFQTPVKRFRRLPIDLPRAILNPWSVKAFNTIYYRLGRKRTHALVDWQSYFHPLDAVLEWNRLYGRKGFVQFQCVLPLAQSREGLAALLERIAASGHGSFLAVLKRMGPQESAFSFPMEGYTLALDFPATRACLELVQNLISIATDYGGRFYLAKDALLSAEALRKSDRRAEDFHLARRAHGTEAVFSSMLSRRLNL